MGLGRGMDHVRALLEIPGVEIGYLCDADEERTARGVQMVSERQMRPVKRVQDIRRVLEDPDVDAISIAAPNHWHAPATILACAAGKHVYVEKPGSHNAAEAEWMVAAARRYDRRVQMGNQRRSWPAIIEMIGKVHDGAIGTVRYARCWYTNARGSIGKGKPTEVPASLDYELWQGPAPDRPYQDNLVHYNWHWRWHWGGGELANNGVHALDLVRWGLKVDYPKLVAFTGGRYHFDDDQETPDTGVATFDFGTCGASWDVSSCLPRANEKVPFVAFYGDGGSITSDGSGYRIWDVKGKELGQGSGPGGDKVHFENFVDSIRKGAPLNSEIGDAQKSAMLCHLGNIAWRCGRALAVNPASGAIADEAARREYWAREYRPGWAPKVG
jgi:predicted dehydrogenase